MLTTETGLRANPQRFRYLHEFLFALNIALVAQLEGNQKPNKLFSFLEWGEVDLRLKTAGYFQLHPHSSFASNVAFLVYSLGLALLIFLLLRISSRTLATQQLLRLTGILSLIALPASWLYVAYRLGWWFTLLSARLIYLLVMELAVVTLCAIAYLYSKWPLPTWANTILLLVHFAFIQTVCFGPYFWRGTQSLVTLAGLCSSLAWGLYVSDQRGQATQHG